jgi:hypothetical protein
MKLFRRFIEKMCPTLEFKKEKRKRKRRAPVKVCGIGYVLKWFFSY